MSSRHSLYKSQADRVWPRAAERSPRTYKVRAMRRSLAFDGFFGAVRCGAALHRIGCRVPDGGATRAVQLAAKSRCRHMMPALLNDCWDGFELISSLLVFQDGTEGCRHEGTSRSRTRTRANNKLVVRH